MISEEVMLVTNVGDLSSREGTKVTLRVLSEGAGASEEEVCARLGATGAESEEVEELSSGGPPGAGGSGGSEPSPSPSPSRELSGITGRGGAVSGRGETFQMKCKEQRFESSGSGAS